MAATYESTQTFAIQSFGSGGSITITKPSNVAVGDLLVAHILTNGCLISSVPSGWTTEYDTVILPTSAGYSFIYSKVADSGDVSATDYTWTNNTIPGNIGGSITRISGGKNSSPISSKNSATSNDSSTGPVSYAITVTPTLTNSLLLFYVGYSATAGTTTHSASGYAVTTDNPTWTEAYDINDAARMQMSMAYATRSATTATGNATVNRSNSQTNGSHGVMLSIEPIQILTVSETITTTETIQKNITKELSDTVTTTETVDESKSRLWTNETKPNNTWTNEI